MEFSDEESREAKVRFMKAFFDDLDSKIEFLVELSNAGHRDEAMMLCSVYIDGLASFLFGTEKGNNFNFVRVLKEFGGEEILSHIHPKMLEEAISKKEGRKWSEIHKRISSVLSQAQTRLYTEQEISTLLSSTVSNIEMGKLRKELWRGTYAAIVYSRIRIPSVHWLGPVDVSFSKTKYREEPVPSLDFPRLHIWLKRIAAVAREKSMATGEWFGRESK